MGYASVVTDIDGVLTGYGAEALGVVGKPSFALGFARPNRAKVNLRLQHIKADKLQNAALYGPQDSVDIAIEAAFAKSLFRATRG